MRDKVDPHHALFAYFFSEGRASQHHPLRPMGERPDAGLKAISKDLDALEYVNDSRPSIAPERSLKAQLLIALYSIGSDQALCEQRDCNLFFRCVLNTSLEEPGLDQSNFSPLRQLLVDTDVAQRFFDALVTIARREHLLRDEHSTVDGTLIKGRAYLRTMRRNDGPLLTTSDGIGMLDFKCQGRTNETHEIGTVPGARLMREGNGQPA